MATDQQFCLRWNNHQSTLISVFDTLLENGTLVDCTLAAEGQYLKAHKVVLSACSPYLETLLSQHYEKHPIVILKDVKFSELKSMMDYMYRGEVNISQDQLGTFLKAAESLQIKGLSDNGDDARDVGSTTTKRTDAPSRPSVTPVRNNVESKRPAPPGDLSDASRDGSISPSSLRKRRRTRRPSQGDDPDLDTNNTCDLPTQAQSTLLPVPSSTVVPSPVSKPIVKQEPTSITRLDNSLNSPIAQESGLLKEKIEPPSEPLLEPKTEYLDYMNNENSIEVEDLTLDDDEEDLDSSMDASRPGPSHGDMSNQGYPHWNINADQSGTDEIFMAAQEAVGAGAQQRDSQEESEEVVLRKSSRPRVASERYISVECRHRSPKGRRRLRKTSPEKILLDIKQEVEDEPKTLGPVSSGKPNSPSPVKNVPPLKLTIPKKKVSPKKVSVQQKVSPTGKIKIEPAEEPSTSSQVYSDLPTINDDLELIQQSIKTEQEDGEQKPKKRGKKRTFPKSQGHKCEFCGRVYKYRKGMRQHQRLECGQEPQFPCPYCPLKFRYRHLIRNHVFAEHNQAFKRWYNLFYTSSKLPRWPEK